MFQIPFTDAIFNSSIVIAFHEFVGIYLSISYVSFMKISFRQGKFHNNCTHCAIQEIYRENLSIKGKFMTSKKNLFQHVWRVSFHWRVFHPHQSAFSRLYTFFTHSLYSICLRVVVVDFFVNKAEWWNLKNVGICARVFWADRKCFLINGFWGIWGGSW